MHEQPDLLAAQLGDWLDRAPRQDDPGSLSKELGRRPATDLEDAGPSAYLAKEDEGSMRAVDGSAGDVDYQRTGGPYSTFRRPDERIARYVRDALGDARTVVNVGAGAGSYEPADRSVTAIEPSATMRLQRPPHLAEAIDATAESLPFPDGSFDAAMTTFSVHQWGDLDAGLRELRRVTDGPIAILTCDPALVERFWLARYAPKVLSTEARRYPSPAQIATTLGPIETKTVPIPLDCSDGFNEAYYGRPEMFLNPDARSSCSAWSFLSEAETATAVADLTADLDSGRWDERHHQLREQPSYEGSLILIVARRTRS
jgi:hypothetical protein